jgi:hypothetical protein
VSGLRSRNVLHREGYDLSGAGRCAVDGLTLNYLLLGDTDGAQAVLDTAADHVITHITGRLWVPSTTRQS